MDRVPLSRALGSDRPVVGMAHLPPLRSADDVPRAVALARRDARALAEGGADAVLVENFGDAPFGKTVEPHVTAALALAAAAAREASGLPVGVNALRNDWRAALGAAAASGGAFVRVNVLAGVMATDQGLVEGDAAGVAAYRRALGAADRLAVLADVFTKHAAPWPGATLEGAAEDTWKRAGADALLVTGAGTGKPADPATARRVRDTVPGAPVLVASGVTPESAAEWARLADGCVVGTSIKEGARVDAPVDPARVRRVADAWRRGRD